MKKIIAILLVIVIVLFSFAACNKKDSNDPNADNPYKPVEEFNEDKLKETWSQGEITFPNGNKLTIPCTVGEFIEKSGMKTGAASLYENKAIKAKEKINLILNGDDAQVKITCQNKGEDDANEIRNEFLESQIGKILSVLVEEKQKDNVYFGYTANYTPVKLNDGVVGEIRQVKIISVQDDFCIGE